MLRAILLLMILAGGAVFVAPSWDAATRTLTLRVRERDEIGEAVRRGARSLGREFVRLLGDRDETPAVGAGGDEAKAKAAGCDGYVTKPFSPRQLLGKVREFLP